MAGKPNSNRIKNASVLNQFSLAQRNSSFPLLFPSSASDAPRISDASRFKCRLGPFEPGTQPLSRREVGIQAYLGSAPKHATLLESNDSGYQPKERLVRPDLLN